ncbi:roadblock/LC7 domain-containing protein [Solwaraspora sp. WMMD406]|uniref:roadblock/LC7 domain-containing protein n=1 Tax=Solwaraspora sp. WMMD406 TaxID=3016095 RepID=UPI00241613DC|nr:roadblock/LC7 domain-containing protein [Solwaraspora sp. WMMD406]MDG4764876.1 roadblock/LC7 domain-containing protein [Solwaraspora sp. WMMD406]
MDTDTAIIAELHGLRRRMPEVTGSALAGVDGLLITADLPGADADSIAALAAASLGLGRRFALTAGHGELQETVIQGVRGYVAIYAAGSHALLTVLSGAETNLGLLHMEARRVARLLSDLLRATPPATNVPSSPPGFLDNRAPLAVRTPMATLPYNPAIPRRHL